MTILVQTLGAIFATICIVLAIYLALKGRGPGKDIAVFRFRIEFLSFIKITALFTFLILPFLAMFLANYHVFERSAKVSACNQCHVMNPFVDDMNDKQSLSLAARHNRNGWLGKEKQCYKCHGGYGLNGSMSAKMAGYRHLMRYLTGTHGRPIRIKGVFKNENCLGCHAGTPRFSRVSLHTSLNDRLSSNATACINCHGHPHPPPAKRRAKGSP